MCSIVIPAFNNCFYTRLCLGSLHSNRSTEPPFEIIVVDNGSTDGTANVLEKFRADITNTVRNAKNLGFAVASNQGASRARGKYLVFLNSDVVVEPGWLTEMVAAAEADSTIGVVGARLLYPNGTLQHAGVVFAPDGRPENAFVGFPADWPPALQARDCQAVTAACMLVERRVFELVDGFDSTYLNSFEDVDLCFKIRRTGRRIHYCPGAVAFHFESVTPGRHLHDDENTVRFLEAWRDSVVVDVDLLNVAPDSSGGAVQSHDIVAELVQRVSQLKAENEHLRRLASSADDFPLDHSRPEMSPSPESPRRDILYRPGRINLALAGREAEVPVALVNLSSRVLAPDAVRLSYHWRRPEATDWEDGTSLRTRIDEPVEPGQVFSVVARVAIPNCVGRFILEWDAVDEGIAWLSQEGVPPYRQLVTILDAPNVEATSNQDLHDRTDVEAASRFDPLAPDWQFLAEEAEYFRARLRQIAGRTASELDREYRQTERVAAELERATQRADELAGVIDGYRNGRVQRGVSLVSGLWSALSGRGRDTRV